MSKLFEDAQVLQPTFISAPPRVWNEVFSQYQHTVALAKQNFSKKILVKFRENSIKRKKLHS